MVLSGRQGRLLWQSGLPEDKDSFYSPVITRERMEGGSCGRFEGGRFEGGMIDRGRCEGSVEGRNEDCGENDDGVVVKVGGIEEKDKEEGGGETKKNGEIRKNGEMREEGERDMTCWERMVLLGTGGETQGGSLWAVPLNALAATRPYNVRTLST